MIDFKTELAKYGLTEEKYEACLKDIRDKVNGDLDIDWSELTAKFNLEFHPDAVRKASSCKPFGSVFVEDYKKWKSATYGGSDSYLTELRREKQELYKEKQKLRDERTDLQRSLRAQARRESLCDLVEYTMSKTIEPLNYVESPIINGDNDAVVILSDVHCGISVDNGFNTYNQDVLRERLNKYLDKIIEVGKLHKCKTCYLVLLGDLISSHIHVGLRLEQNENTIEQIKTISVLIGEFIQVLQKHFEHICVSATAGNHGRLMPSKDEALKGENLEDLIPFYLKLMFKGHRNVSFVENFYDESIISFVTRGDKLFYATHGTNDKPGVITKNLSLMTGARPHVVLFGHLHHSYLNTEFGVKVVGVGSVVGSDSYAVDKRLTGNAEQTILITNNINAIECRYDVNLQ